VTRPEMARGEFLANIKNDVTVGQSSQRQEM
jgi:hypothetical protein